SPSTSTDIPPASASAYGSRSFAFLNRTCGIANVSLDTRRPQRPWTPAIMPRSSTGRQPLAPRERCADEPAREPGVTFRIVQETEIGAARIRGWIVDAAIRIDLEHERRAASVDTK